jgi:hypothetical protein
VWLLWGFKVKVLQRRIAAVTMAGIFGLAGMSAASADVTAPVVKKVALTPEQKAAFDAAKAAFKTAQAERHAAITAVKAAVASAKGVKDAAIAAATTKDARIAARSAFKGTVASARAAVPVKPVRPVRP